jgi:hypothetical protein
MPSAVNGGLVGTPTRKYLELIAQGTIARGKVVSWYLTNGDGITVTACSANTIPLGVAVTAGVAGKPIRIQTRGLGEVAIAASSGTSDPGDFLYAGNSGNTAALALGTDPDEDNTLTIFGVVVKADVSGALAPGSYYITCPHSWWDD